MGGDDAEGASIVVRLADGNKCPRCWRILPEVGRIWRNPEICWRCNGAMDAFEAAAVAANARGGDWRTDPEAFRAMWRAPFEAHPIRALARDPAVTKLVLRRGRKVTTKTLEDGDEILEVWGDEEQMPWCNPPRAEDGR